VPINDKPHYPPPGLTTGLVGDLYQNIYPNRGVFDRFFQLTGYKVGLAMEKSASSVQLVTWCLKSIDNLVLNFGISSGK